ncbi:MAG TPA: DUF1648 domain-containing protein [Gemmatimonadaceae bacterium]|nr:DUF1648 domain-containing protein [Gemmatimonadaceae bacterium]
MRKWVPVLIVLIAVVASAIMYPQLPERMPTHWSRSGEVTGWSSRFWGAWMMPLILAGTWLLMRVLPHIDPRRDNYANFRGAYETIIISVMLLMLAAHILILESAMGRAISFERLVPAGVGLMFIVVGIVLPRLHSNWFVGIRTPWTLSSDLSWKETHRVGGYLFIAVGAVTLLTAVAAPTLTFKVLFAATLIMVTFVFAYSYVVWKRDPARSAS